MMGTASRDLKTVVKEVKDQIKNVLSEGFSPVLVSFAQIGMVDLGNKKVFALVDQAGDRIRLKSLPNWRDTTSMVPVIPDRTFLEHGVVFGLMYYDAGDRSMCLYPLSIVKETGILRLLY